MSQAKAAALPGMPVRRSERPISVLLGYDPELLAELVSGHRRALDSLTQAWLVACIVLSFPVGLAMWLVEHSVVLSVLAAGGTYILVVNLLRLITAGAGLAPEKRFGKGYRPSALPAVLLLGLALLMSQPAQLLYTSPEVRAAVEEHREKLISSHETARAVLLEAGSAVGVDDAFATQLRECEFVVLRLKLLWSTPESAVLWTAIFVALGLFPAALGRLVFQDAVLAYEQVRHRRDRKAVRILDRRAAREVVRELSRYPTYRPPWPFPLALPLTVADVPPVAQPSTDGGKEEKA